MVRHGVGGTNQTGELCGVLQALLWLREHANGRAAMIAVDSVYAANEAEGWWRKNKNAELIEAVQKVLEQVQRSSDVTFIHVRGHIGEEGNERADRLVQWGKTEGPYSRLKVASGGEGDGGGGGDGSGDGGGVKGGDEAGNGGGGEGGGESSGSGP